MRISAIAMEAMTNEEKSAIKKISELLLSERDKAYTCAFEASVGVVCVYAARAAGRSGVTRRASLPTRGMTDRQIENFSAAMISLVDRARDWNQREMISDDALATCERIANRERVDTLKILGRKVRNDGA